MIKLRITLIITLCCFFISACSCSKNDEPTDITNDNLPTTTPHSSNTDENAEQVQDFDDENTNSSEDDSTSVEGNKDNANNTENNTTDDNTTIDNSDNKNDNSATKKPASTTSPSGDISSDSQDDEPQIPTPAPDFVEQENIQTDITDDGITITIIPDNENTNHEDNYHDDNNTSPDSIEQPDTSKPINVEFPEGFDIKNYKNTKTYYTYIDGDGYPDVVMEIDSSHSLIWLYDSVLKDYIYNEELSRIPVSETPSTSDYNYEGLWTYSQMQIEIFYSDSVYTVIVSSNANSTTRYEWLYYCELSGTTGNLDSFGNGTKTEMKFDADGNPTSVKNKYENGKASFSIDSDGYLHWNDSIENAGKNCKFSK